MKATASVHLAKFVYPSCPGQASVAGSVGGFGNGYSVGRRRCGSLGYRYGRIPSRNRPVDGREEEDGWCSRCQQRICLTAVGDGAGWSTLRVCSFCRDGHDQRRLRARSVVQRAEPCRLIRDPPWAAGISGQSPWIYQLRIGDGRQLQLCLKLDWFGCSAAQIQPHVRSGSMLCSLQSATMPSCSNLLIVFTRVQKLLSGGSWRSLSSKGVTWAQASPRRR